MNDDTTLPITPTPPDVLAPGTGVVVDKLPRRKKTKASKPAAKEVKAPVKAAPAKAKSTKPARKPGPAMLKVKVKAKPVPGICAKQGCSAKTSTARSKWCSPHKKEIRKAQLAANNVVWRKRVEKGTAGHHLVYRTNLTEHGKAHPKEVLKAVKAGTTVIPSEEVAKKLLEKAAAQAKAPEAKAQKRAEKAKAVKPPPKKVKTKAKAPTLKVVPPPSAATA